MRSREAIVAILLATTACTRAVVQHGSVEDLVASSAPTARLAIKTNYGLTFDMRGPTIVGDSIIGYSHGEGDIRRKRHAVAKTDIEAVLVRKPATLRTFALLGGIALGALAVAASAMEGVGSLGEWK
jgi:hypothetical protein